MAHASEIFIKLQDLQELASRIDRITFYDSRFSVMRARLDLALVAIKLAKNDAERMIGESQQQYESRQFREVKHDDSVTVGNTEVVCLADDEPPKVD